LKHLISLKKYFWRNKYRFIFGILFTTLSNYFGVLSPQVTKYVINKVVDHLDAIKKITPNTVTPKNTYDPFINMVIQKMEQLGFNNIVIWCGIVLLLLALLRGFFTFLMRQTIIVMSRHIEFDQKNDIYKHYQTLDALFFKKNSTGDLMNRISEDVGKVRMFTGPAIMYSINLIALISLSVFYMLKASPALTLYTLAPLPILAFVIFKVNTIINKKSEQQQQQLSLLTSNAQESYSGIRVIKSFVQENALLKVFTKNSNAYKDKAISLATTEAAYFPSIALLIGISTLLTIMIGGLYYINGTHQISLGTIAEFVIFINMLTFPVSSIGWVASMIQRASASQKRINEFLHQDSNIVDNGTLTLSKDWNEIKLENVSYTYEHTQIQALKDLNFILQKNEKIAIIGKTGSGKTTLVQLLLRMYNISQGSIKISNQSIENYILNCLRQQISYVPQEVFLFSETIYNNIKFGVENATKEEVQMAAKNAQIYDEIMRFENGFETMVGERGVTLSGGQKQRISIARALLKKSTIYIFDDCLSAVDIKTEVAILNKIQDFLKDKTAIFVTHRIFNLMNFDKIIVLDHGAIVEIGTAEILLQKNGAYAKMYAEQNKNEGSEKG
jgi:ATP-binding cassette, subfamily B, multidrug efflux pump